MHSQQVTAEPSSNDRVERDSTVGDVTAAELAKGHQLDLEKQVKHDVDYVSYWFEPSTGTVIAPRTVIVGLVVGMIATLIFFCSLPEAARMRREV